MRIMRYGSCPLKPAVEGSGLRRATQASERRLVEDALEDLVAAAHPAIVTGAFARVSGRRYQPGVGSELVCTLEGTQVACRHQELGPEDRPHAWQASEDPSLRTGEKTLPNLLIYALDACLEAEDIFSELRNDARGYLLCGQG